MNSASLERKKFFFNPLRSPLLWAFFAAHLLIAVILGRVYAFAPDEGGYLGIFKKVYRSDFDIHTILGWKDSQVTFLRLIYSPGRLLEALGVSDFLALRIVSIAFSGLSLYLLLCVTKETAKRATSKALIVIAIIPSSFVWMTLGLREPFLYASLSLLCTGIYFVTKTDYKFASIFIGFGFLMALETKPDIALLVFCSCLCWIAIDLIGSKKIRMRYAYFALAFFIPILLDFQGVRVVEQTLRAQLTSVSSTGATSIATYADQNAIVAAQENLDSTTEGLRQVISEQPDALLVKIIKLTGLESKLTQSTSSDGKDLNKGGSTRLNVSPAKITDPFSVALRSGAFLFTPFPLIDNGSLFLNILSFESPLWWFLYVSVGIAAWRRFASKTMDALTIFVLSFSALFILFSALTEINVGTLTRHRSVLLFPFVFLIFSQAHKSETF